MKKASTYILMLLSVVSFAQENNSEDLERIEFMEKVTYKYGSELLKNQKYNISLDENYVAPWKTKNYTKAELKQILDAVIAKSSLKVQERYSSYFVDYKSYFPQNTAKDFINGFKLTIKSAQIKNEETLLDIYNFGIIDFESISSSTSKNEEDSSQNWTAFNANFDIDNAIDFDIDNAIETDKFKGSIEFEMAFKNGFDFLQIKASDVGKKLKIGDYSFTVEAIYNNLLVLDFDTPKDLDMLSFANLNDKGQKITDTAFKEKGSVISKETYLLFKENPNLSFKDYQRIERPKIFKVIKDPESKKDVEVRVLNKRSHIFRTFDKLINGYLYIPKNITKVFKKEYIENEEEQRPIKD